MTIFRIILLVLMIGIFGLIFYFSHQPATQSKGTSGKVIRGLIDHFPYTKDLTENQKDRLEEMTTTNCKKASTSINLYISRNHNYELY